MVLRKDVAKHAGVSLSVVSRVINKSGYVAEDKKHRVLKAIEELNYRPNPVAVSLKQQKTKQLLYYISDPSNTYYSMMYSGMTDFAYSKNYNVLLSGKLDEPGIMSLLVDGIVLPSEDFSTDNIICNIKIPYVVATYCNDIDLNIPHINVDVISGIKESVDYLKKLGHKKIGFISPDETKPYEPRPKAFKKFAASLWGGENNVPILGPDVDKTTLSNTNFFELGALAAEKYIKSNLQLTACIVFNDDMATGFMSYLQNSGMNVPEDISVIGIDGHLGGAYTYPGLTTISLNPYNHGVECARVLIDLIEGNKESNPKDINSSLIVRKSTIKI